MGAARPGPGTYQHDSALGRQAQSARPSGPEYRVGTGERFQQYKTCTKSFFATPGHLYDTTPTSGFLGDKPKYSFHGQSKRSDVASGLPGNKPSSMNAPGPGAHDANVSCLFDQADSRRETSSRTRVGTANRDLRYTQYISKEHEVDLKGKHSPAPNTYLPDHRYSSRVKSSQKSSFGSGDRFSQIKSGNAKTLKVWTPGPGAYVV
jgi:hypothetical protein